MSLIEHSNAKRGMIAGQYRKFIHNHHIVGYRNPRWNPGRRTVDQGGYSVLILKGHPLASRSGFVREHEFLVYEAMGGKLLPPNAQIHHFDEVKSHNVKANLVVCENDAYHKLLHYRQRALRECGNADWMRCKVCKAWDDPLKMYVRKGSTHARAVWHRPCINEYNRRFSKKRARKP